MSCTYRDYQKVIRLALTSSKKPMTTSAGVSKCMDSTSKPKITRTKTGCLCCRKRKKKCDELRPKCSGCRRNYLECVYPDQPSPDYCPLTPPLSASEDEPRSPLSDNEVLTPKVMTIEADPTGLTTSQLSDFVVTSVDARAVFDSAHPTIGYQRFPKQIKISSLLN
ncbi:unnamed protein product [Kuraishia capsulata CBS 1993]|uniref:Zn(2)-C6 fungal-type domain-containing protein n=1 Tax=Kuraishia capsulata CBS 1993 TaxID=1382522 RepID=W6MM52_9ASCO|nr:uncharacterized protein KUCA_T00003603001 [Kuraishia capsulata CBS 1993]CDK27624.1 unnamed protein product [Kuraishia capsulata CBS 1993]